MRKARSLVNAHVHLAHGTRRYGQFRQIRDIEKFAAFPAEGRRAACSYVGNVIELLLVIRALDFADVLGVNLDERDLYEAGRMCDSFAVR